jgi:hypothetical protein
MYCCKTVLVTQSPGNDVDGGHHARQHEVAEVDGALGCPTEAHILNFNGGKGNNVLLLRGPSDRTAVEHDYPLTGSNEWSFPLPIPSLRRPP